MIQDVGNIELGELLVTEPKTQWNVFIILEHRHSSIAHAGIFAERNSGQPEIR